MKSNITWAIDGFYSHDLWRNEQSGLGMFSFCTSKDFLLKDEVSTSSFIHKDPITKEENIWSYIVCDSSNVPYPRLDKGTPLVLQGNFERNRGAKYKSQWVFKLTDLRIENHGDYALIKFLTSKEFPEMTQQKAFRLCNYLHENNLELIEFLRSKNSIKMFADICKTDYAEAKTIVTTILSKKEEEKVFRILSRYNIPYAYAVKAVKRLGKYAASRIKSQPFSSLRTIGLSLDLADRIASDYNLFSAIDTDRISMASHDVFEFMYSRGDTFFKKDAFSKMMEYYSTKSCLNGMLEESVLQKGVTKNEDIVYSSVQKSEKEESEIVLSKRMFNDERQAVLNIMRLNEACRDFPFNSEIVDEIMAECGMKYGKQQRQAFETLLKTSGVKILTGGPGTGKTTTVKGIILAYKKMFPEHKVSLCAPTGRAAQRMSESTEMPACTVHRLLNYVPYGNGNASVKNHNDPIDADLVVCDEASMLDMTLFSYLLDAIKTGGTIIFMGDTHQLPSVGAGAVLKDICDIKPEFVQQANLSEVFRQKGGSPIIDNSIKINEGNIKLSQHRDFRIIRTNSPEQSLEVIKQAVRKHHDPKNPFDTQILCPAKNGISGVDNQNKVFQDILNPSRGSKDKIYYGKGEFRTGDKIIMLRNNYEADYMNGDIGVIQSIDEKKQPHAIIRGKEYILTSDMLEDIKLAYAMTIHKSQGSEFKTAIVVMPENPSNMLVRNLFYTGITRAKKNCIVISEGSSMEKAIRTDKGSGNRRTSFSILLMKNNMLTENGVERVLANL